MAQTLETEAVGRVAVPDHWRLLYYLELVEAIEGLNPTLGPMLVRLAAKDICAGRIVVQRTE